MHHHQKSQKSDGLKTPKLDEENQELELQAEKERLKREEKIKQAKELSEALKHLKQKEYVETRSLVSKIDDHKVYKFNEEKTKWELERFRRSGKRPDPLEIKSINTYVSLLLENASCEINQVLADVKLMLSFLEELRFVNQNYSKNFPYESNELRKQNILQLESIISQRYNDATLKILQESVFSAESDTGNLRKIFKGEFETFLIWGNLGKNPRLLTFNFPEEQIFVDINKTIATANIAIRIIVTKYDHLSNKCSTFYEKKLVQSTENCIKEGDAEIAKSNENITKNIFETNKEEIHLDALTDENIAKQDDPPLSGNIEEHKTSQAEHLTNDLVEGTKKRTSTTTTNEEITKNETKKYFNEHLDVDLENMLDPDVVDLRQFTRIGNIISLDIIRMPVQPSTSKSWTLRQVTNEPLETLKYPDDIIIKETVKKTDSDISSSIIPDSADKENEDKEVLKKDVHPERTPTIGITMPIPDNIKIYEEPLLARWDSKDMHWKTSGLTNIFYDEENKKISFETEHFASFCLLQDTHLNMPYQMWELQPTGGAAALFTVVAVCSENIFEIEGSECRLLKPEEETCDEFEHIYEKWMDPDDLIRMMKDAGNVIFPNEDSVKFVSVAEKELNVNEIYDQIAYLSPSFGFGWSKFANDVRENEFVLQVAPVTNPKTSDVQPLSELVDVSTYIISDDRSYRLHCSEQNIKLDYQIAPGCNYHTDLLQAVQQTPIPKNGEGALKMLVSRTNEGSVEMASTVKTLLQATNVLTFS